MSKSIPIRKTSVDCPICSSARRAPWAAGADFEYDTSPEEFSFARCLDCGVLYLQDRPDISEIERIYPPTYLSYFFHRSNNAVLFFRNMVLEKIRLRSFLRLLPAQGSVLDAGCGDPLFLERLRKYGPKNIHFYGNDVNAQVLVDLKSRGFKTIGGLIERIDMPAGSFDVIFMRNLIEHLARPREVLAMAARLMKSGGSLLIQTPNTDCLSARVFKNRYWFEYHFPRHWVLFDAKSFRRLAGECGLEVQEVVYRHSPYSWVLSLHHLLKDRGFPPVVCNRFHLYNPLLMAAGSVIDLAQQIFTARTSNMQVLLRKP